MDNFAYCENLVREADKDRFLATLFAPDKARRPLFALYAFSIDVARVRERARDPMAGEIRLQWWRDVLGGTRASEARAYPPAAGLFDTIVRLRLPVAPLLELIEARSFDLYPEPMPSLAALEGYVRRTSSTLFELAARILEGPPIAEVSDAAASAGMAYGITGLLRMFGDHASRGKLYVPTEVLDRHGARVEDVFSGRGTRELGNALAEMRNIARRHYTAYIEKVPSLPTAVAPAFLPVALVPLYLKRLERRPLFARPDVPQWRRQWTLWQAARRA
jgi:phytoene synthase